jgi:hypothetical protein
VKTPTRVPNGYDVEQAMSHLLRAQQRLLAEDPELAADERLMHDMLEGDVEAGDYMDVIHRMMRAAVEAETMHTATKIMREKTETREKRWANRHSILRTAIFEAMQALRLKRIDLPDVTSRTQRGQRSVLILDEDKLPDDCVEIRRSPKKLIIKEKLAAGDDLNGAATLSNGADFLVLTTT